MKTTWSLILIVSLSRLTSPSFAYEHQESLVNFVEYADGVVAKSRPKEKPYFLLFSAEWCHWCHEFAENTLVRKDVASYLNQNFVNVFIDVDIHHSAYVKYRATGLPYTVFLNPDGSLYYKFTGTLYGDDFLDVVKEVAAEAGVGKYALGMESNHISYTPPETLSAADLEIMRDSFIQGILDNFDEKEYGVGKGQKSILPRTFLYLLQNVGETEREEVVRLIDKTLERAIDRIYDPIEGGFFRYAEKRDWKIPHYEKFADLNAGAVLLLHQVNHISPSTKLEQAADTTVTYLNNTLFNADKGSFLSFQIADDGYYFLGKKNRETARSPKVMDKIFIDRLAVTLDYLIPVTEYRADQELQENIRQSLDFLVEMIMGDAHMSRYYALSENRWLERSGLSDHAHVAKLFTRAAAHFQDARYTAVAIRVIQSAISDFYDNGQRIFIEPGVDNGGNVEYLMEMNGLLALSMIDLSDRLDSRSRAIIGPLITYFSRMADVLKNRLWDAVEWEFAEAYIPYLRAVEKYRSM